MTTASDRPQRLSELDGLRGLAAATVVMAHYTPATLLSDHATSPYLFNFVHTFSLANIGVLFFFGLSAFLLSWLAEKRFAADGRFDAPQFLLHRFFRIVPIYVAVLLLSLVLLRDNGWFANFGPHEGVTRRYSIQHIWVYLTFLYNWPCALVGFNGLNPPYFNELAHLWSLSVEVQFYLAFALFFPLARKASRHIGPSLLLAVSCGILARLAFLVVMAASASAKPSGFLYFFTLSYLETFLVCGLAGMAFAHWEEYSGRLQFLNRRGTGAAIVALLVAAGWTWRYFLWNPPQTEGGVPHAVFYAVAILHYSILGLLVAVSLLWLAANGRSRFGAFLKLPLMRSFGTLSYGIYLWHLAVKFALVGVDKRLLANLDGDRRISGVLLMFVAYFASVVCMAGLTYWAVEAPFNGLRRRFDSRRSGAVLQPPQDSPYGLVGLSSCAGAGAVAAILLLHV